jgi:hypothetical protein
MEPVSRQWIGKYIRTSTNTNATVGESVSRQRIGEHTSTTIELLLETVFFIRSVLSGYIEENWGIQFS